MSRIGFSSAAFWGDVMPCVPVARELVRRGHDVVCSLPAGHHAVLEGEAFSRHDNGSSFTHHDVLSDPAQLRVLDAQEGSTTGTKMLRHWAKRYIAGDAEVFAARTAEVLSDADVLVAYPTAAALAAIRSCHPCGRGVRGAPLAVRPIDRAAWRLVWSPDRGSGEVMVERPTHELRA